MDKIYQAVAKRLPKKLIYYAFIVVLAHGTVGKYGDTEITAVPALELLKRFGDDYGI